MVAYYFPPIGGIGSIRLAEFARHLPEFGWEPLVLAPARTPHALDDTLSFAPSRVVRSRSIEPSRIARKVGGGATGSSADDGRRRIPQAIRSFGRRVPYYPDAQIGWYPGALVAGRRALRHRGVDAVYSSSFPITAHLVARALKRRAGAPWVAEFRDPWSVALPRRPHRARAERLEKRLSREADKLIMPTPTWANHFGALWNADVAVVPNGYDERIPATANPAENVMTHLGTYYPGRQSLAALWRHVGDQLRQPGAPPPRIRFVGELSASGRAELEAAGVAHLVEETGTVPHREAVRLAADSTMLFGAGSVGTDPVARGWVPAKLFEYLATEQPILYLGDPNGDAGLMLRRLAGCHVVRPSDEQGIRRALQVCMRGGRHPRAVEDLTRRAGAARLAAILDEVHSLPGSSSRRL